MIHVCYGLHDKVGRYSKFTGISILSMFENTRNKITVHLLHDNTLTDDNREKFNTLAGRYGQRILFYNVENLFSNDIAEFKQKIARLNNSIFSVACMYRFFIPQLLSSESKAIYLDSDTVINLDINELWKIELDDSPIAAIYEKDNGVNVKNAAAICKEGIVDSEKYFNSGVLVMNLEQMRDRQAEIQKGLDFVAKNPQYEFFDQDILNYCFADDAMRLPVRFNRLVPYARRFKDELQRNIYHYSGQSVDFNIKDKFNMLFMEYFTKTAWFNIDTIRHFGEYVQALYSKSQRDLIDFTHLISGKKRVFYLEVKNFDKIRQIFKIDREEKIFNATRPDSLDHLMRNIRRTNGKRLYILLVRQYDEWKSVLKQAGFVEGSDFINAMKFFSEDQGLPMDTRSLVQAI